MSALVEVYSFVNKFLTLCNNGESADLSLKCHDGKTVINLQLDLSSVPPPPYHPQVSPPCVRPSPSRLRRSAQRAHSRAVNTASKTEEVSADCSPQTTLHSDKTENTAEQAAEDGTNDTENVLEFKVEDDAIIQQEEKVVGFLPAEEAVPLQSPQHEQEQNSQESLSHKLNDTVSGYQQFELVCNFCEKGFGNETLLKDHTIIEHNSGRIRYRVRRT